MRRGSGWGLAMALVGGLSGCSTEGGADGVSAGETAEETGDGVLTVSTDGGPGGDDSETTGGATGEGTGTTGDGDSGDEDALEELSDEFDDPASLGDWRRIWETEGWPYDQLETLDVDGEVPGFLTMAPYSSSWFEDYRGVLLYKEISGDLVATTRLRVTNRAGDGPPSNDFSLAGVMLRTPRPIRAETWVPGGENYIFLSVGRGSNQENPGAYENEVKTTIDSRSTLAITRAPGNDMEIRGARVGAYFFVLLREPSGQWSVHRRYARPDMPTTLQVGMVAYTDWAAVSADEPAIYNNWSGPPAGGQPDIRAEFDYYRFRTPQVPAAWRDLDLSDPAVVPDEEILAVLGVD